MEKIIWDSSHCGFYFSRWWTRPTSILGIAPCFRLTPYHPFRPSRSARSNALTIKLRSDVRVAGLPLSVLTLIIHVYPTKFIYPNPPRGLPIYSPEDQQQAIVTSSRANMPRLRIIAGPSLDNLTVIEANSGIPLHIKSETFEGSIVVHIKGFADVKGNVSHSSYFDQNERKGITWSIQTQGLFI